MERVPRRAAIKSRARACLFAAGLALLTIATANPFASPDPTPPPAPEIPLPPDLIDQLPPLPAPSITPPALEPEPTPEERLETLLPKLERPNLAITPHAPSVTLALPAPTFKASVPQPRLLEDATAHAAATSPNPALAFRQALERMNVQLLAVILSGTPQAVLSIEAHPHVIPYGQTLPYENVRVTAVLETGVILTYQGVSIELPLGATP